MVIAKCTKKISDKDQKAQELIVTRVEENILTLLTSCATAYDMWEKLTTVYEAKSKVLWLNLWHRLFIDKSCADWYSSMIIKLTVKSERSTWKNKFCESFANNG
ncbi:unnamed protein product [Euphydryas editha]|uniref:Uncharacterized protein n=1 Tax=Euphydryas editha TaxID=104508 RepID=A0AAU9UG54_EUPED|nr:unnamed protein product [Euphydryas editha]